MMWLRTWQLSFCPHLQLACKLQVQLRLAAILSPLQPWHPLLQALADKIALPCCFFIAISTLATADVRGGSGAVGQRLAQSRSERDRTPGVSMLKVKPKARGWAPWQERHPARGPARRGLGIQAAPPPAVRASPGWAVTLGTGMSQRGSRKGFA